jgi:hypothetical protein
MTNLPLDTEEQVLEAAIGGLSRVAEAILATPNEARTKALDAAEDSYHRAARDLGYDEAKIEEWVSAIMFRLRAEISAQELAQQQNEPKDDAPSLMPASASQNVFRLE